MSYLPAVFLALIWMWSDSIGTLLSVISTYFYFGWEGTPALVPKIFGLALFAFSGPLFYRVLLFRLKPDLVTRGLLLALFALYTALSLHRESDFFAWGSLTACWLGGITLMSLMRQVRVLPGLAWAMTLQMAFFFYLSTRISQGGLPLILLAPQGVGWMPWLTLIVLVLVGLFLPQPQVEALPEPLPAEKPSRGQGSLGVCFGLLMGLSVGVMENLHIWSARTPAYPAAVYFLSLALGVWGAFVLVRAKGSVLTKLGVATPATALGIYGLLYFDVSHWSSAGAVLAFSLVAHTAGSLGLLVFWSLFFRRFQSYQQQSKNFFPWVSLQVGFVFLLLILAVFLLQANPAGFWVALALSALILAVHESKWTLPPMPVLSDRLKRLGLYACALFALVGGVSLFAPRSVSLPSQAATESFQVMSTNVRYGWTDDYRFEPLAHVRYLRTRLPHLMGIQELNKGHTSGAYSDLFRLYQQALPAGQWFYGDANYGFGNALLSQFKVLKSENRVFTAKDMLKRSCLVNTVEIKGRPVTVLVTHLSHLAPPNLVREAQVKELVSWIQELKTPWILIGDFNATPDSPEVQTLIQYAHSVFREQPEWLNTFSFPAVQPDRRIDYIFFSQDFLLKKMEILDNGGTTDHRPVLAELMLPDGQ